MSNGEGIKIVVNKRKANNVIILLFLAAIILMPLLMYFIDSLDSGSDIVGGVQWNVKHRQYEIVKPSN